METVYTVPLHLKEKVKQLGYDEIDRVRQLRFWQVFAIIGWVLFFGSLFIGTARAYTNEQIADAIYLAEGGVKTNHPYGILIKYKITTPRQACLNTIAHAKRDWDGKGNFIEFLGLRYCPPDAHPLNKNWVKNVNYFLTRRK